LIPKGEPFGLLTRIAATVLRCLVRADEKLIAPLELEAAIHSPPIWIDKRAAFCQPQRR